MISFRHLGTSAVHQELKDGLNYEELFLYLSFYVFAGIEPKKNTIIDRKL